MDIRIEAERTLWEDRGMVGETEAGKTYKGNIR